jgi:hypothetical protein
MDAPPAILEYHEYVINYLERHGKIEIRDNLRIGVDPGQLMMNSNAVDGMAYARDDTYSWVVYSNDVAKRFESAWARIKAGRRLGWEGAMTIKLIAHELLHVREGRNLVDYLDPKIEEATVEAVLNDMITPLIKRHINPVFWEFMNRKSMAEDATALAYKKCAKSLTAVSVRLSKGSVNSYAARSTRRAFLVMSGTEAKAALNKVGMNVNGLCDLNKYYP